MVVIEPVTRVSASRGDARSASDRLVRRADGLGGLMPRDESEAATLRLELLNLHGALCFEVCAYDDARRALDRARMLATQAGRPLEEALARRNLGVVAARRGHFPEAVEWYESALERLRPRRAGNLPERMSAELAALLLGVGRYDEARQLLTPLQGLGVAAPPDVVAMAHIVDAGLRRAAGESALEAIGAAVRAGRRIEDAVCRVSLRLRAATLWALEGARDDARSMLDAARAEIADMPGTPPILVAQEHEAAGAVAAAWEDPEAARRRIQAAILAYGRIDAGYDVARMHWRAAAVEHAAYRLDVGHPARSMVDHLEEACRAANRHGYVFAGGGDGDALLELARVRGLEQASRYIQRAVRMTVEATGILAPRGQRGPREVVEVTTREGTFRPTARELNDMLASVGHDTLVLVLPEQDLILDGQRVSLAGRVTGRLLAVLLASAGRLVSNEALAAEVWPDENPDPRRRDTRVKVCVSRLRGILGDRRGYLETGRLDDDGGTAQRGYGLAPDAPFMLVRSVDAQPSRS